MGRIEEIKGKKGDKEIEIFKIELLRQLCLLSSSCLAFGDHPRMKLLCSLLTKNNSVNFLKVLYSTL